MKVSEYRRPKSASASKRQRERGASQLTLHVVWQKDINMLRKIQRGEQVNLGRLEEVRDLSSTLLLVYSEDGRQHFPVRVKDAVVR